jgi:hypothetical protein
MVGVGGVGETKSVHFEAYWTGIFLWHENVFVLQVTNERLLCLTEGEAIFSVYAVGMELKPYSFF